jgi:hypothetical protein
VLTAIFLNGTKFSSMQFQAPDICRPTSLSTNKCIINEFYLFIHVDLACIVTLCITYMICLSLLTTNLSYVVSEPFGCVISVFCVRPHVTDLKFRCALSFNFQKGNLRHSQYSDFHVPSTTPSDGLPRDCFLFIVPKFYLDEDSKICVIIRKA